MSRLRPSLVLAIVVVLLATALFAVTERRPEAVALDSETPVGTVAGSVPVSSATRVCPDSGALVAGGVTDITLVTPALPLAADTLPDTDTDTTAGTDTGTDSGTDTDTDTGTGTAPGSTPGTTDPAAVESTATLEPLAPDASPLVVLSEPGPSVTATVRSAELGPAAVRSVGTLARGLSAMQLSTAGAGEVTGVAGVACTEPSAESWFLGVGTEIGHRPRLTLANAEQAVADVDVVLYGPDGPLDVPTLSSIVVPALGGVTFELDTLAPDLAALAVAVQVRSGRVTAALRDSQVDGLSSRGVDWVPASTGARSRVVVPGVSGGAGPRVLQLLAPGELDTRVDIRLLTSSGAIVPAGLEAVELTAGAVASIDLAEFTAGEVAAVELVADQPLVAGLRVLAAATGDSETAYSAGSVALSGPAVIPDVRSGDGWVGSLLLTADEGGVDGGGTGGAVPDAEASVAFFDAATGDPLGEVTVSIPAGSSAEVPLALEGVPLTSLQRFSVVVTPLAGAVIGSAQLGRRDTPDAGFTILPLFSPQLEVRVPAVRQDLSTGLRPHG